jgi:1-hydroxycarotenoid 3,4-desaturase
MMQAAEPKLFNLAQHVMAHPHLIGKMAPLSTLSQLLMGQFRDVRLRQLFGRYSTYVGGAPHLSPAVLALIWHAEASGLWCVRGGMHALATAMGQLADRLGVTIKTGAHVESIDTRNDIVNGVTLNGGSQLTADVVIHAGDPRALAVGALGTDLAGVAPSTAQAARSFSARVHSFSAKVSGPDLAHHNVFFADDAHSEFRDLMADRIPEDPTLYLCAEDRGFGTHPQSVERFEMIANAPATHTNSQPEDLPSWHQMTMTRMAQFGVTFSPTPTEAVITTPQTFANLFPESLGSLYGQSPHGLMAAFKRPTARTPVTGLYLCGGGTHPGAGVPMATLSARHAVAAILKDRTSTSRSMQTAMRGGMSTA